MARVDNDLFSTPERLLQLQEAKAGGEIILDHHAAPLDERQKMGTVGAVALDLAGNLAAATSTGGMTNKLPGRVGDSPLPGAGATPTTPAWRSPAPAPAKSLCVLWRPTISPP